MGDNNVHNSYTAQTDPVETSCEGPHQLQLYIDIINMLTVMEPERLAVNVLISLTCYIDVLGMTVHHH